MNFKQAIQTTRQQVLPSPRKPVTARDAMPMLVVVGLFLVGCLFADLVDVVLFTRPWAFALIILAPWFWWMAVAGKSGLSKTRAVVSLVIRLGLLALFILALAEPRAVRKSDAVAVMFVVDQSTSIGDDIATEAKRYVARLVGEKPEKDLAGMVAFGRNAAVELPPAMSFPLDDLEMTQQIDRNGTDLAKALALSAAVMPDDKRGRIVLVSDGAATEGNLDPVLNNLKARGIPVDVLEVSYNHKNEVIVERLELPRGVKAGESYEASVIVTSKAAGEGDLVLLENGQPIFRNKVEFKAGKNRFAIPVQLRDSGYYEYTAQLEVPEGKDGWKQNNKAISYLHLEGEGKVLLVTNPAGDPRDYQAMQAALGEGKRRVEVRTSLEFPNDPLSLLPYDAVMFVNVPRDDFVDAQLLALKDAIKNQGTGFLMVGGENSFGPGGYHKTAVEEVLPVNMDVTQKKVLPKGALAIVLHTCEFPAGNTWGKRITKQALKVLNRQDEAGVLAFDWNGGDKWIFNLMPVANFPRMARLINNAQIGDMPTFGPTMQMAFNALSKADAASKHMIIISDGDPQPPAPALLQAFADNNISITTVAVFPHGNTVTVMKQIAAATGGRFYFPKDPNKLPSIFIKEARTLKRSMIQNKTFAPEVSFPSNVLKGIDAIPQLHGYVLTTPKGGTNRMVLKAPSEEDEEPVLSVGNFGVGKTAAFTSDLSSNWGKDWVSWDRYSAFVNQLTTEIARRYTQSTLRMQSFAAGDEGVILVEDYGKEASFRSVFTKVIKPGPDGKQIEETLLLKQTGPRRYEGKFKLTGEGRYQVITLSKEGDKEERLHGGFVVPYAQEFLRFRSDPIALQKIANRTGGRLLGFDEKGEDIFGVERKAKASSRPVFDWFLFLLCLLVPLDVAIRRVQIDMATIRGWFGSTRKHQSDEQTMGALLAAKRTAAEGIAERTEQRIRPRQRPAGEQAYEVPTYEDKPTVAQKVADAQKQQQAEQPGSSVTERLLAAKRRAQGGQDDQTNNPQQ